jgi:hypothetical protein
MARGWWNLTTTTPPTEDDLVHIAKCIKEGYTSGEIVNNEEEEDDEYDVEAVIQHAQNTGGPIPPEDTE